MTADSTEDIIQKLEAVRSGNREATKSINEVVNIIMQIRDLAVSTASVVEEQSTATSDIARRMSETAQGSQGITGAISEVATMTQSNSEGIVNVHEAAGDLESLANRLQELVSRFKI